jgi:hypothetical protein
MPDQVDEEIEDLGLDGHEVRTPAQFPTRRVEYNFLERIAQLVLILLTVNSMRPTIARALQRKNGGNAEPEARRPEGISTPFPASSAAFDRVR